MNREYSQARRTKDRSYDGKFFFAVKTTGIFCRPSCPSPIAKEENVIYVDSLFEALGKGFRPCSRCRPDIEIDYYSGSVRGAGIVKRALEHIYSGYLSYQSINDLAGELAVSDRHLRQLFVDHFGVPPVRIATYHKALFAKKLLPFSDRSITDIAFASGFGSLRQFNDVFKKTFGQTPSAVRNDSSVQTAGNATLMLKYRPPMDFRQMLAFVRPRAIAGVETVTDDTYGRTFRTDTAKGAISVMDVPEQSALALGIQCDDIRCYMEVYHRVRKMFDLDRDLAPVNRQLAGDQLLAGGVRKGHVPRLPVAFDPFEFAVRAILGQQISVAAATRLAARIVERASLACDTDSPGSGGFFFPSPQELLALDLDGIGIPGGRQDTISRMARAVLEQELKLTPNQAFADFHRSFTALKGVGDWTAQYVGMRGLGMSDCFPVSDLGVIKALATRTEVRSRKEMLAIAERWRPYRSYATLCLWNRDEHTEP